MEKYDHLTDRQVTQQTLERAVRIETRVMDLAEKLGVTLGNARHIEVQMQANAIAVYLPAMDVPLSHIQRAIEAHPKYDKLEPGQYSALVWLRTKLVGTFMFEVAF